MDLRQLTAGWQQFKRDQFDANRKFLSSLVTAPPTKPLLVINCIDARLNFRWITSQRPGTISPHQTMGAIVPPCGSYSLETESWIEFGLNVFKSEHICIVGHTECKMIKALLGPKDEWSKIGPAFAAFANIAHDTPATVFKKLGHNVHSPEMLRKALEIHTLLQVRHLMTYPSVQQALAAGQVQLHPIVYDLEKADLYEFSQTTGRFELLSAVHGEGAQKLAHLAVNHDCGHDHLHGL